jgi:hypothetical protein
MYGYAGHTTQSWASFTCILSCTLQSTQDILNHELLLDDGQQLSTVTGQVASRLFANSSVALCKSGLASKRRAVTLAKTWDGKRFHRALQNSLPLRRRSKVLPQATAVTTRAAWKVHQACGSSCMYSVDLDTYLSAAVQVTWCAFPGKADMD